MVFSRLRKQTGFVVLSPSRSAAVDHFRKVQVDNRRHDDLCAEMQRFRGAVYLKDGAIRPSDLSDGRHKMSIDEHSWHVLSLDSNGRIRGVVRFLEERSTACFNDLWVRQAALARSPTLGSRFRRAVETEMERARRLQMRFGEVGGWAVAEEHRWTLEPLRIILAAYGLGQLLGGCAGVATATMRHKSASILRRIGLNSLRWDGAELPPYYDPRYQCEMEVLQFDTRIPNPKYRDSVRELSQALANSPVICRDSIKSVFQNVWRGFEMPINDSPGLGDLMPAMG